MSGVTNDHESDAGMRHDVPRVPYEAHMKANPAPRPPVPVMALASVVVLASGFALASSFG
jgi:hypothetical protein